MSNSFNTLILTDPTPGHTSQTYGVVEALHPKTVKEVRVEYLPLARMPNLLPVPFAQRVSPDSLENLQNIMHGDKFYDLIVATGRRLGLVSLWLKKQLEKKGQLAHSVQIMDPGLSRRHYDLIAIPAHDRKRGAKNIIKIGTAPNRINVSYLNDAREKWHPAFVNFQRPIYAVLVGGDHKRGRLCPIFCEDVAGMIENAALENGADVVITTSRRTTKEQLAAFFENIGNVPLAYNWQEDGGENNPYSGMLAYADVFFVTGESVSMVSEVLATGKPVFIIEDHMLLKGKHRRFIENLYRNNLAKPAYAFEASFQPPATYNLNSADYIAGEINKRFASEGENDPAA